MPVEYIMIIGIVINLVLPVITMIAVCEMFCRDEAPPSEDD